MMRKLFSSLLEIVEIALITLGAVFLIRSFLVQPFLVSGASMSPNMANGDYLLVDELTYHFRTPARGEIVVFRYPKDLSTYFIKRIIGLPNEKVQIKDNTIIIFSKEYPQGFALGENYLPSSTITSVPTAEPVTLGNDEYFLMGDNRSYSFDSRSWGPAKANEIIGIARFRLYPFTNAEMFGTPQYP